ncbi:MAG: hypothetical protein ACI9WU_002450 [Myxococcota bacterium]|jgi:hypothetical protein
MSVQSTVAWMLTALVLGAPQTALAAHASGSRTETVAFSVDGLVLVRHVAVQHGVQRYEVIRLPEGLTEDQRVMSPDDDPEVVERELISRHGLAAVGFPGPVSPSRGAAVLVLPGSRQRTGAFEYTVLLTDGDGPRDVALIPVQHGCVQPREESHSRITGRWAPDGRTLLLVGSVLVEPECGLPREEPVLVVVRAGSPASPELLAGLSDSVQQRLRTLADAGDPEASAVATQVLAMSPDDPAVLVLLAQLRAARARPGAALATLWTLARVPGLEAAQTLRASSKAAWTAPLRNRAAWHALQWHLEATGSGPRGPESAAPRPGGVIEAGP